jgi:hypothetical protein
VDERSYLRVATTLNTYGLWTSWCSQFLTEAAVKLVGLPHLQRSLRSAGWTGESLVLYTDVDPGSGFGYGYALIENRMLARGEKSLVLVRDHVTDRHMSYVLEGKRSHCVSNVAVPR